MAIVDVDKRREVGGQLESESHPVLWHFLEKQFKDLDPLFSKPKGKNMQSKKTRYELLKI